MEKKELKSMYRFNVGDEVIVRDGTTFGFKNELVGECGIILDESCIPNVLFTDGYKSVYREDTLNLYKNKTNKPCQ